MSKSKKRICWFLIPMTRGVGVHQGAMHNAAQWEWLKEQLLIEFGGYTPDDGPVEGEWLDPEAQEPIREMSLRFWVGIDGSPRSLRALRSILQEACRRFAQKCIFLVIGDEWELVEP